MALARPAPPPGTARTVHLALTAVGFDSSNTPSDCSPTLTVPKNSLAEEPARKGAAMWADRGRLMRCPVEKDSTRVPRSSGTGPASGFCVTDSVMVRVWL